MKDRITQKIVFETEGGEQFETMPEAVVSAAREEVYDKIADCVDGYDHTIDLRRLDRDQLITALCEWRDAEGEVEKAVE